MGKNVKIHVENLTKKYGDLLVLDDISFDIQKGEFVCVVGPTGCGKTTFLNLLSCLIEPTQGQILIDGVPADPKKHDIAFVFQEPSSFPWLTVKDNIGFGMKMKDWPQEKREKRENEILKLMGLEKFAESYPSQLSVSTEQRMVIGRAFAMNPDLLLMDEPYGQMDSKRDRHHGDFYHPQHRGSGLSGAESADSHQQARKNQRAALHRSTPSPQCE